MSLPRPSAALIAAVAGLGGAAGLAVWATWIEPRRVVIRRRELELPGWPSDLDGLRVAVVADLHTGAPHVDEARVLRVVERVNREHPDLVALLGDYVDPTVALGRRVEPEAVAARLARLEAPRGRFAVLGNHDRAQGGRQVARALRGAGLTVLHNSAEPAGGGDGHLWVAGFADPPFRGADVDATLNEIPDGAAVVGLTHSPDLFPRMPPRVALTLAGHTHRGQINLPLIRALAIPSRYGATYAGGHVEENGRHLYVSGGVGTSRFPVRLGAPPEIGLLRLRCLPG
jgi:predicted MPP superfamily phosphohydrolase